MHKLRFDQCFMHKRYRYLAIMPLFLRAWRRFRASRGVISSDKFWRIVDFAKKRLLTNLVVKATKQAQNQSISRKQTKAQTSQNNQAKL